MNMRFHLRSKDSKLRPALAGLIRAAAVLSAIGSGGAAGISQSAAQDVAGDVAYVEGVSGRVVAFSRGRPVLLDALDIIIDRTRIDLQSHSELRICHYGTQQLVILKGPARASVSADGVTAENGNAINASAGICATPVASKFQGGLVSRGVPSRQ
jgi:hypothetical protein